MLYEDLYVNWYLQEGVIGSKETPSQNPNQEFLSEGAKNISLGSLRAVGFPLGSILAISRSIRGFVWAPPAQYHLFLRRQKKDPIKDLYNESNEKTKKGRLTFYVKSSLQIVLFFSNIWRKSSWAYIETGNI